MSSTPGHPHRDRRQLRHPMTPRLNRVNTICLDEQVRTRPAALRPMLDDLVHLPRRKQPPVPTFMPGFDRLAADPTPSHADAAAPTEGLATAAATSCASFDSAAARARPLEPRAARSPRPARPPATTTPQPPHDHRQGSPPPRPAPRPKIRRLTHGPRHQGERLHLLLSGAAQSTAGLSPSRTDPARESPHDAGRSR
jgi:hypothetical protein